MPTSSMSDNVRRLLAQPNPAVMSTVRSDGQPVSVATWYLWENSRVLVNMNESRKRLARLRVDPRVTVTVLSAESWYTYVSLQGLVAQIHDDLDLVDIDRLSHHYLGKPYWERDRRRVSVWIDIDRWHSWVEETS